LAKIFQYHQSKILEKFAKIIKVAFAHPSRKVRQKSCEASVYRSVLKSKQDDPNGERENFLGDFGKILGKSEKKKDD
jgi:hypothetical protein